MSVRVQYLLILLSALSHAAPAAAQVIVLHSFTGTTTDGQNPEGSLTPIGSALYGMTQVGGAAADGTLFRINADGSEFGLLHSFAGGPNDGVNAHGSLAASGAALYGMTQGGGSAAGGTVFRINADGTGFGLLHHFLGAPADGNGPLGTPVLAGQSLFGWTPQGGTSNLGTIFRMNADSTGFVILRSYTNRPADARGPGYSTPVLSDSTLYGMSTTGGAAGLGAVFKLNTDGTGFSLLHSFNAATGDGWAPSGSLTLSGSTLYGMTRQGGGAAGTIFRMNTDGTGYQILHSFAGQSGGGDGANPLGSLLLVDSTLYGMTTVGGTANLGTIFKMNIDGTGYERLHSFAGGPFDGANPQGDLTLVGSNLYGMTVAGGENNLGTIFSFPVSVPEPSSLLLAAGGALVLLARRRRRSRRCTTGRRGPPVGR